VEGKKLGAVTVGFAIAEEDRAQLDDLVAYYGQGNRSEFLRVAMKRLARDRVAERLALIQQQVRAELDGKVFTPAETQALIDAELKNVSRT
jgi:Arc/MetJ-type ribon-helix-helix transcriptional regulator